MYTINIDRNSLLSANQPEYIWNKVTFLPLEVMLMTINQIEF